VVGIYFDKPKAYTMWSQYYIREFANCNLYSHNYKAKG